MYDVNLYKLAKQNYEQNRGDMNEILRFIQPKKMDINQNLYSSNWKTPRVVTDVPKQAAFNKASRILNDFFGADSDWGRCKVVGDPDVDYSDFEDEIQKKVIEAVSISNFLGECRSSIIDSLSFGGTLSIDPTNNKYNPIHCRALNMNDVYPISRYGGVVDSIYRDWKLTLDQLQGKFPNVQLTTDLKRNKERHTELNFVQAIEAQRDGTFKECLVYGDDVLKEQIHKTMPAVFFRQARDSGDGAYGRGILTRVMSDTVMLNNIMSAHIKGINLMENPAMFVEVGSMAGGRQAIQSGHIYKIAKGSNPPVPLDIKREAGPIKELIFQLETKLRTQIEGEKPFPDRQEGNPKTAMEIMERANYAKAIEVPSHNMYANELANPAIRRIVEILTSDDIAGSPYHIQVPKEVVAIIPNSRNPMIDVMKTHRARRELENLTALLQVNPVISSQAINIGNIILKSARLLGFTEDDLNDEKALAKFEADVRMEMAKEQAQQRIAQEQGSQQPTAEVPLRT